MHNFFLWTFLFLRFFPLIFLFGRWDGDNNLKRMFGWNNNNNTRVFSFHSFIVVSRHFLSREGIQFLYIFRYIYIWFNNNRNFNLQYSLELCSCFLFFFLSLSPRVRPLMFLVWSFVFLVIAFCFIFLFLINLYIYKLIFLN